MEDQFEKKRGSGSLIDPAELRKWLRVAKNNWYILFFCLGCSGAFGYLYMYKQSAFFGAKSSIKLDSKGTSGINQQLFGGFDYKLYEHISNEIRIVKSYDIIKETVTRMDDWVDYFIQGRFKTTEVYEGIPFYVNVLLNNSSYYGRPFHIKILNFKEYSLQYEYNGDKVIKTYKFGEKILEPGLFTMVVKKNPNLTDKAIKETQVGKIDYIFRIRSENDLISRYLAAMEVHNVDYTSILELTVTDGVPKRAVKFLDSLYVVYTEQSLKSKKEANARTLEYIKSQMKEVGAVISDLDQELEDFKLKKDILDLSKEQQKYFSDLANRELILAEYARKQENMDYLKKYIVETKGQEFIPARISMDDDSYIVSTVQELYGLQLDINNKDYFMKLSSATILEIKSRIQELIDQLYQYIDNTELEIQKKRFKVEQEIYNLKVLLKEVPLTQREMKSIQRRRTVNEKMHDFLLQKFYETQLARASIVPDVELIEKPRSIGTLGVDKTSILYTSIGIGGGIGIVLIFLRVVLFKTIESVEELKSLTNIPILGEVDRLKDDSNYLVVDHDPKSHITESFRSIRTNLEYMISDQPSKILLVTSYLAGEGKTFCSINLASILAKAGKKVLLLELDLHRPRVGKGLNIDNKEGIGLTNVLIGKAKWQEIVLQTEIENLDVLLSGAQPPNASELILSKNLVDVLSDARGIYDYVIIDTPPIGLMTDALYLMKYTDINLFVLNAKFAKKEFIEAIHEMAESHNPKNLGLILNAVKKQSRKYYYYYGYRGYGYSDEKNQ